MSSLYFIKVQYQNVVFKVMIDSGAQISIISPDLVKQLNLNIVPYYGHVQGVGHNKLIGKCQLHCHLLGAHCSVMVDLYIMPSHRFTIFGLDFLEKYQCVIHCQRRALYINHTYIPFVQCKQNHLYKIPKQNVNNNVNNNVNKNANKNVNKKINNNVNQVNKKT